MEVALSPSPRRGSRAPHSSRGVESEVTSWSTAKSFTSLLVGIAIEDGYINSLTESASTYISEWSSDDRNTITICSDNKDTIFKATGSVIKFDGFLKLYKNDSEDEDDENRHERDEATQDRLMGVFAFVLHSHWSTERILIFQGFPCFLENFSYTFHNR